MEREILSNGKSRAYAGSRPVTLALLKDLAPLLGDIHGQHDQQLLFSSAAQLQMLDGFANTRDLSAEVRTQFRALRAIETELVSLRTNEQEKLRLLDLWQFQRNEIESIAPVVGEDTALDEERRIQQNVGRVTEAANAAFSALYESPESALALVGLAMKKLDELSRIDSSLSQVSQMLDPAKITIQEASYTSARLSFEAGRQSGAPGTDRDATGRARPAEAQVRRHAGRSARISDGSAVEHRGRGNRR